MSKSNTVFELEQKIERYKRRELGANLIIIALSLLVMVSILYTDYQKSKIVEVPKNLGGILYENDNAFIRFDTSDPKQVELLNAITQVCKANDIQNCMKAYDIFNLKGGAQ